MKSVQSQKHTTELRLYLLPFNFSTYMWKIISLYKEKKKLRGMSQISTSTCGIANETTYARKLECQFFFNKEVQKKQQQPTQTNN